MPRRAGWSPRDAALPSAAWIVFGPFSCLPPFFLPPPPPPGFFASACALASVTGPSPWACFLGFSSCFFLSSAMTVPLRLIDLRAAALGDAHPLAVLQQLGADAGGLLRLGVHQREVGDVDAAVLLHDPALGRGGVAAALVMALEDHQLLHHGALPLLIDLQHLAGLALLLAGEDVDVVAFLDANLCSGHVSSCPDEALYDPAPPAPPPGWSSLPPGPNLQTARNEALQDLRRQRDDLHELLRPELAGHRSEDAGADGLAVLADHHGAVGVELDVAAVGPLELALGAYDHRPGDLALLHLAVDQRLLDAGDLLRAGVVGDVEHRGHLDHD